MKTIIRRDIATGKISCNLGEYEFLIEQGKTDEEIAEMVVRFNESGYDTDRTAELIELDEVAQFYKEQQDERRAEIFADLEVIAKRLQNLADDLEGAIKRVKR